MNGNTCGYYEYDEIQRLSSYQDMWSAYREQRDAIRYTVEIAIFLK